MSDKIEDSIQMHESVKLLIKVARRMASNRGSNVGTYLPDQSRHPGDVWERLVWLCHSGFFITLALASVLVLTESHWSWSQRGLLIGLSVLLLGWFGVVLRCGPFLRITLPYRLVYFAVGWSILGTLMAFDMLYIMVFFALLWQTVMFIPKRWSIPGLITFTGTLTAVGSVQGEDIRASMLEVTFPMVAAMVAFYFVSAIIDQSRERQKLVEELGSTRAELAVSERQAGVLEERQRLAREIHDTLAQGFTSIVMHLEATDGTLDSDPVTAKRHMDQARITARESLAEARRLVWALRPEVLERSSLPEALQRVAESWSEETGIPASAAVTGAPWSLHPEVEVMLLRSGQEALANVRRHAQASRVMVTLSYIDEVVVLDVQDDGIGFDPLSTNGASASDGGSGFGLVAMRERAEQLGGTMVIESDHGQGTTVAVEIPSRKGSKDGTVPAGVSD